MQSDAVAPAAEAEAAMEAPAWAREPEEGYSLEILKQGIVLGQIPLEGRAWYARALRVGAHASVV
jgi:hypothetical protein